jgi:hypothetical protein
VGIGDCKNDGFGGADGSLVGLLVVGWNDGLTVGLGVGNIVGLFVVGKLVG